MGFMLHFVYQVRRIAHLSEPYTIPHSTLLAAINLTTGISLGYAYLLVFNYAFQGCDQLVDVTEDAQHEIWFDALTSTVIIFYSGLSLFYVWHRTHYGILHNRTDTIARRWINVVLAIVWVKVVIYKGYISQKELCSRKELEGYWCPIKHAAFKCHPNHDLTGMKAIWYNLHQGLLKSAVVSIASELFPVLLVTHWLACGGAHKKAEKIVTRILNSDGNRVRTWGHPALKRSATKWKLSGGNRSLMSTMFHAKSKIDIVFILLSVTTLMIYVGYWFINFYYTISFDEKGEGWMPNEVMELTSTLISTGLFAGLYVWSLRISDRKLDVHLLAEAQGDIILLVGSLVFLLVHFALKMAELQFNNEEGLVTSTFVGMKTASLSFNNLSRWLQFLCLRRIVALNDEMSAHVRGFMPVIAATCFVTNWVSFGLAFLESSTLKYQLTAGDYESFEFSRGALICNIFTEMVHPADYLYAFTAAGVWMDILLRSVFFAGS
ncbi:Protein F55G1.15 [Aphelenchoides avenae]|nr:Protein F55G1.15 [Aphelenchus avenae]